MTKNLGVAIIGAGWVSGEHIRAYQANPHTRVVGIFTRTPDRARQRIAEFGLDGARVYDSFDQALADPDVHLVSICSPPNEHPAQTIAAARAGKHLLIEKAVANNIADLRAMCQAVREANVRTVVSFVLRWNPQFQLLTRLLDQEAIGKVFYAEVDYWHAIGPWYAQYAWNVKREVAGSALLSAGCHAVDAIRWFVRDEIVEVSAYSNRVNQEYEYDTNIVAAVKFAGGAIGKISTSLDVSGPYMFNIDLLGEKGTIRDNRIMAKAHFPGQTDWIEVPTIRPDSGDVTHHPFQGEIDHFVECVLTGTESHVSLFDAAKTHEVCYAMDLSAAEGRAVRVAEL
jgi:predicted dehydrogenase